MNKLEDRCADDQHECLLKSIYYLHNFSDYAKYNNRYAIPGEVDTAFEWLQKTYDLMYPGKIGEE